MPSIIKTLPSDVIDKIAAGEVVERPASVVKELVENSIDADASHISVFVEHGGHQTICVVDNGLGMNNDDLHNCYTRHATSKMSTSSDLFNINSLGFRGEALSSISSVSFMSIETRARGEKIGSKLVVEGGIVKNQGAVSHAEGSSVTVKNLFYNTPARRKFLKKIETESRHIVRTIINLAAAYPNIAFVLQNNGREVMRLLKSTRIERAADLLGVQESDLIWIDTEYKGFFFKCALCCDVSKIKGNGRQYIVVRKRPVVSRRLTDAIYKGCGNFLPEHGHPAFITWLDLNPELIDVNVHPTKKEIRIENETEISNFISESTRNAIVPSDVKAFKIDLAKESNKSEPRSIKEKSATLNVPLFKNTANKDENRVAFNSPFGHTPTVKQDDFISDKEHDSLDHRSDLEKEISETVWARKNIWQAYDSFILVPLRKGLLVIDQSAAHERVLYERARENISVEENYHQQLLIPLILKLSREDYETSLVYTAALEQIGFSIKPFGELTLSIDSIPSGIRNWEDGALFRKIINDLIRGNKSEVSLEMRESLLKTYSKSACVENNTELKNKEIQQIFEELMACKDPFFTPDGIPIISRVVRSDLERLLGRS